MAQHAHGSHTTEGAHGDLSEHAGDPETGAHGDHPSVTVYWVVFALLMALLVAAVWAGHYAGGTVGTVLGFAIGIAKAILIIMYFMHVRYGTRLTWIFSGAAFLWLALLLSMTMNDYFARGVSPNRADPMPQVPLITTDMDRGPIERP